MNNILQEMMSSRLQTPRGLSCLSVHLSFEGPCDVFIQFGYTTLVQLAGCFV